MNAVQLVPRSAISDRLEFSSGTAVVFSEAYRPDSVVPVGPWRKTRPNSSVNLTERRYGSTSRGIVEVVRFPHRLLVDFHRLFACVDLRSVEAVKRVAQSQLVNDVRACFEGFAEAHLFAGRPISSERVFSTLTVHPGGLETVTIDSKTGLRTGLHVDSWSTLPLRSRAQARPRVCANFGWSNRYLLFVPLPVDQLVTGNIAMFASWARKRCGAELADALGTAFSDRFLHEFPSLPVARLCIRPGEAYIAPTENLIHDGSSSGAETVDVSCHVWARYP